MGLELSAEVQPSEALGAREAVAPVPAHFSAGVWACSCCRAGGLFAWGASRAQQPPQAPAQALGQAPQALEQAQLGSPLALAPRAQARAPRRHFPPFLFRKILIFVVQKNRKGNAGAAGVYDITVHVGELEAPIAQSNRAVEPHEMSLVGSGLHDKADPFVDNELANDILSEGALDFGSVGERGAPQKELAVGVHRDEVVDLQGTVDETWPQKVVDGERPAGRGARRVAPGAGELAPELRVVQHAAVPVVGDLNFVGLRHVVGRSVIAADPGRQPSPGVGADGQGRPVQGLQGLVDPVEVLASVRGEEGVRHAEFEDAELGARLHVDGLPDVELKARVVPRDALPAVYVDRCHDPLSSTPKTPHRRLGAVRDLPGPVWVGPPGVHHPLRGTAALYVVAFTIAHRAAPQQLPHHLAENRPHTRLRGTFGRIAPKTCLPSGLAD